MADVDPSRTLTIRRQFSGDAFTRFRRVKGLVRASLVDGDALRVRQADFGQPMQPVRPGTGAAQRVDAFIDWLVDQHNAGLLSTTDRDAAPRRTAHWAGPYVRQAYAQGVRRARQELERRGVRQTDGGDAPGEEAAAAAGVAALLLLPVHADGLDTQWGRTWAELRNVVETVETQVRRVLTDGLGRSDDRRDLTGAVNDRVDTVGVHRARLIARTETVRAHAEAQLSEMERQGVDEVGAEVEFRTARDSRVCPICRELEGATFGVDEARGIIPVHPNPMSLDTEVYTRRGWVPVGQVTRDDDALSLEPGTFDLGWQPVVDTVHRVADRMVQFSSRNFDHRVSADHNVLVDTRTSDGRSGWRFVEAEHVPTWAARFYRSSQWRGHPGDVVSVAGTTFPVETFCEFMGWWLAEGSFSRSSIVIHQSQHVNPDNYDRIVETCRRIAPAGRVAEYAARDRVSFSLPDLRDWLDQFGKAHEKWIPDEVLGARPQAIRAFLDAYARGDGSAKIGKQDWRGGGFRDEITYCTSSRRMADQLGEALVKVGRRPSYSLRRTAGRVVEHANGPYAGNHDTWVVTECYGRTASTSPVTGVRKDVQDVPGGEPVACVSLPRWHTLLTRRSGKVVWTGNCRCVWLPVVR